jgi:peptide-methionine (S)-S-oxide reductase
MGSDSEPLQIATLGGGCFWCLDAAFRQIRGVVDVVSGYAGGWTPDPSYEEVCSGATGHAEVVQVHFDPAVLDFHDLLRVFFAIHDPTTPNRQGADLGTQYRSIVLTHDDQQRCDIDDVVRSLETDGTFGAPIVTDVEPLQAFHPAETYHQDYFRNHPRQPYCQAVIAPKVARLRREMFARLQSA